MIKKTIAFEDYNGTQQTEDFYFNLSKAEITEMELTQPGGLAEYLQEIVRTEDRAAIIAMFKGLVLRSYGVRSEDGLRFKKSDELREAFEQHPAFSELFIDLVTNAENAAQFVNGLLPQGLVKAVEEQQELKIPGRHLGVTPAEFEESMAQEQASLAVVRGEPTQADLTNMTREELIAHMRERGN